MDPISTRKQDDVLIVTSNNPPVNALGLAVREGLVRAIAEADGDAEVKAVVLRCEGQTFFAGADISEFGTPKAFQTMLPQVVDIIENCTKPVISAIHGTALGGGLEVALTSHYRVALPLGEVRRSGSEARPPARRRRHPAAAARGRSREGAADGGDRRDDLRRGGAGGRAG